MTPLEHSLAILPSGWWSLPGGRRAATVDDPLLFAYTYLRHHLTGEETGDQVTFSQVHFDWAEAAKKWMGHAGYREHRDAFIAPRAMGKSTWWFTILPLWAAAHGHVKYVAAFADSGRQAEEHLSTFRTELETNTKLREDYPLLCTPMKRRRGATSADRQDKLESANGFIFRALGIDSKSLGMKTGTQRPDLLIFDDIEPDESAYSELQVQKRLATLTGAVFPINEWARVVIVGTVTMPGSIVHQLLNSVETTHPEQWIVDNRIAAHYAKPFLVADDGTETSVWPEKWAYDELNAIRHTREFALNFLNQPISKDSPYWTAQDIVVGHLEAPARVLLSVDPAVTKKKTSDRTGLTVLAYSPSEGRVEVRESVGVRLVGEELRAYALKLLERHPDVTRMVVETIQGGDLWDAVFHHMPVRMFKKSSQAGSKEARMARGVMHYQAGRVVHIRHLPELEAEMLAFPRGLHDDLVDSCVTGVEYLLTPAATSAQRKVLAYA